jgi:tetratricopeptide (TPR) repeat protein
MRQTLLGDDHPDVALTRTSLGDVLLSSGRFEEAAEQAELARNVLANKLAPDHWRTGAAESVYGAALTGLARYPEAETALRTAKGVLEADDGTLPYYLDATESRLAALYAVWSPKLGVQ